MKILVIEDEHKIAAAVKRGLEQESYAAEVAHDSDTGLSMALAGEYDLIILDRMLPGLVDGIEVCKEIRANAIHVPIIMLTAKDAVADRVVGLNAGADDYLVKPFAFEELLARVRALLRRPSENLGTELVIDDLVLNPSTFEVARAGKPVQLSQREFALLEYLMRNQNRIVTRTSIIDHVWDYDADVLPNTVEVYMGYLRNKLEKPFAGPQLLHTIRGFGYKLAVGS